VVAHHTRKSKGGRVYFMAAGVGEDEPDSERGRTTASVDDSFSCTRTEENSFVRNARSVHGRILEILPTYVVLFAAETRDVGQRRGGFAAEVLGSGRARVERYGGRRGGLGGSHRQPAGHGQVEAAGLGRQRRRRTQLGELDGLLMGRAALLRRGGGGGGPLLIRVASGLAFAFVFALCLLRVAALLAGAVITVPAREHDLALLPLQAFILRSVHVIIADVSFFFFVVILPISVVVVVDGLLGLLLGQALPDLLGQL
jgi:hypothetical protein